MAPDEGTEEALEDQAMQSERSVPNPPSTPRSEELALQEPDRTWVYVVIGVAVVAVVLYFGLVARFGY